MVRAVGVTPDAYGGPEVLQVFELPEPHAGPGTVRIAVCAAAVNPTDTVIRSGRGHDRQQGFEPPFVPGMDIAGVIDEVGPETGGALGVGDRVMAMVVPRGSQGGYRDTIVVPASSVVRVPAGTTLVQAATLPMNGLTARLALDLLALTVGSTLAVTGAAGTLGGYVIQLAKDDGLRVVADAAPQDESLVRSFGADVVLRRGSGLAGRILEVVPEGVDGVVDAALLGELIMPAVRDGGALAAVRPFDGHPDRGIVVHQVWVREYRNDNQKLDRLRQQAEDGVLGLRVAGIYPAERAVEAHVQLEKGGIRGRLVLQFRDEPS
jgi:NADPH:quinone reductase-like Zn-dependent oxidoreductase